MDKQTCIANLNLLSINNVIIEDLPTSKLPDYIVILYNNGNDLNVGYVHTTGSICPTYSSYKKLLEAAIIMTKEKNNG